MSHHHPPYPVGRRVPSGKRPQNQSITSLRIAGGYLVADYEDSLERKLETAAGVQGVEEREDSLEVLLPSVEQAHRDYQRFRLGHHAGLKQIFEELIVHHSLPASTSRTIPFPR